MGTLLNVRFLSFSPKLGELRDRTALSLSRLGVRAREVQPSLLPIFRHYAGTNSGKW